MGQVRKATQPLKETLDKINMPQAVIDKLYPKMKGFKLGEIEYKDKSGKTVVRRGLFPPEDLLANHQTEETGFTHEDTLQLTLSSVMGSGYKYEPIFVFKKEN